MFQFYSNSLLIALLLCHYSKLYNIYSLYDTTIHNRNSFVRYAAKNLLVTDNLLFRFEHTTSINSMLSHTLLLPSVALFSPFIALYIFSLMNVPEIDDSRSLLLEKSFATVCTSCCHACLSLMPIAAV